MATYPEIQNYVERRYGWRPKTCWIAHCKEMKELPLRNAQNRFGVDRVVPCPPDKRDAIFDAFRHFGMIRPWP